MQTLVIHPTDRSTDFLKTIYQGRGFDVLNRGGDVTRLLPMYDRIVMMGHGSSFGLFSGGMFPGDYVIDRKSALALRGRDHVFIWCHAKTFCQRHGLSGFATGMFVSEVNEAVLYQVRTSQKEVTRSNDLFAEVVSKNIGNPSLDRVLREYRGDGEVIEFNRAQMRSQQWRA